MTRLLIARHGNTFDKGDVVCRVGKKTDLPLSHSGKQQAILLGEYLKHKYPEISVVFTSTLKRTQETARIALDTMGVKIDLTCNDIFDEIDYGPDEGKPESDVIARVGEAALKRWEDNSIVPPGWNVNPSAIQSQWIQFGKEVQKQFPNQTILVVTSNGIARFAPEHAIKLGTGRVSLLTLEKDVWSCQYANHRP